MSQEYGAQVLYHREDTGTLKSKIPGWGGDNLGFDTVGNWSNEFLGFKNFGVFRVNEGDDCEFDDADEDDDDIFFVEVAVDADVDHEPDDLGDHQYEAYDEKAFLKKGLSELCREVILGLVGFELNGPTLAIDIIIEVNGVNFAQLNLTKTKIRGSKGPIIVVHKPLSLHFGNLIIDAIDSALRATSRQHLFVLGQVVECLHIMIIVWASVPKRCY